MVSLLTRSGQIKDYEIGNCCFSAKHAALRSKNKDWLARNQNNVSAWSDMSDVYIDYRSRLTWKVYFYCSFFLFFSFFFYFCLQQYATMDNSSLIPYYNTQSELKVLIFGEIMYYQSNNLTTRARSISQFSFFSYSGLFD